jgi:hypothetical protein
VKLTRCCFTPPRRTPEWIPRAIHSIASGLECSCRVARGFGLRRPQWVDPGASVEPGRGEKECGLGVSTAAIVLIGEAPAKRDLFDFIAAGSSIGVLAVTTIYVVLTYRILSLSKGQLEVAMYSYSDAAVPKPAILLNFSRFDGELGHRMLSIEWEIELSGTAPRYLRSLPAKSSVEYEFNGLGDDAYITCDRVVQVVAHVSESALPWWCRTQRVGFTLTESMSGVVDQIEIRLRISGGRIHWVPSDRQSTPHINRTYAKQRHHGPR